MTELYSREAKLTYSEVANLALVHTEYPCFLPPFWLPFLFPLVLTMETLPEMLETGDSQDPLKKVFFFLST